MLEVLIILLGGAYLLAIADEKINLTKRNKSRKETKMKFDNMTTYEIDTYLKENNLYDTYGSYSREAKIERILDYMERRW